MPSLASASVWPPISTARSRSPNSPPWRRPWGTELTEAIAKAPQIAESEIRAQRIRVAQLKTRLLSMQDDPAALNMLSVIDSLVRRSIWIVGGDGLVL